LKVKRDHEAPEEEERQRKQISGTRSAHNRKDLKLRRRIFGTVLVGRRRKINGIRRV